MSEKTKEIRFEEEIEHHLIDHGWIKGLSSNYDKEFAIDTSVLFPFLQNTQAEEWEKLIYKHGDQVEKNFLTRLHKECSNRGMLDVLRKGIVDAPAHIKLVYFKPASTMNQTDVKNYSQNVFSITRQLKYSLKNENSLDTVLFINGLPIVTIELKNGSSQKAHHAINQYKFDRHPKELLFNYKERALIHFALDPDEVYMTSKLAGKETLFLPFNKGNQEGKGNPLNPKGCRTAYLWEEILQKDSILDIVHRFIHRKSDKNDKKESLIFPRYHQLDVVRKLVSHVKAHGSGENYLIQHSAGSGKSNSIAWLSHHLQRLHDESDQIIFNSVIVVTDRKVLDNQLQETIYQFEHDDGVVIRIDKHSKQLADALNTGKKIIITTLQKFPFILDKAKDLSDKRFAIIIDEAHSSQTGESSAKLKEILGSNLSEEDKLQQVAIEEAKIEDDVDPDIQITKELSAHGKLPNLSFFAFTATPKQKTLEMFGTKDSNGLPEAFHLYSMKQAIEEGFILNILKNYITYKTYFNLTKDIPEDPTYGVKKANKSLGAYLNFHPHNLAQKTEIMIEHFRTITKNKIGGKAKAMLVTGSRLQAVRYYYEFQKYIKENGYEKELKILVAFSGTIQLDGQELSEHSINQIKDSELPMKFKTDEFQILLVAEKYQTGFDEPLLHTMFVDKPLEGVRAVQTLSRLNRTCQGKEDTLILDFVNDIEIIKKSFESYYKETSIEEITDANLVYDLKNQLESYHIYWESEIDDFANVFFKGKKEHLDFSQLNQFVDPAVDRYKEKSEQEQEDFKTLLIKFIRTYSFISNLVRLDDKDLHKLHAYTKFLAKRLPYRSDSGSLTLDDEVELQHYRLQKMYEGSIELEDSDPLPNDKHSGTTSSSEEKQDTLSNIINKLNDQLGADWTETDKLFVRQIFKDLEENETLKEKAQNNSIEYFGYPLQEIFEETLIKRFDKNKVISEKILDDKNIQDTVIKMFVNELYQQLRRTS